MITSKDKNRQASVRPPRRLRREVEASLRRATLTKLATVRHSEDGNHEFLHHSVPPRPGDGELYLWRADLPRGLAVECLVNRPMRIEDEPGFPLLIESLAAQIHRGTERAGITLYQTPGSEKAVTLDGLAGQRATFLNMLGISPRGSGEERK